MGADIAELCHEAEQHIVLFVEWSAADDVAVLINAHLESGIRSNRVAAAGGGLCHFGKLGEEEEDSNGDTRAGDCKVNELHIRQVVLVLAGEEELGGDEGTDEASHA